MTALSACATAPSGVPASATRDPAATADASPAAGAEVPELNLNLPETATCACTPEPAEDFTFLTQGYHALLDGEYEDAMENFRRYQRLESSPRADLEAGLAIAYLQMLPRSPFYDPELARASFKVLREQDAKELKIHDYTRLMRQAVINLLKLESQQQALWQKNRELQDDLKKREEALKRLRELTLGQKGSSS